jgi:hypothetical protein
VSTASELPYQRLTSQLSLSFVTVLSFGVQNGKRRVREMGEKQRSWGRNMGGLGLPKDKQYCSLLETERRSDLARQREEMRGRKGGGKLEKEKKNQNFPSFSPAEKQ